MDSCRFCYLKTRILFHTQSCLARYSHRWFTTNWSHHGWPDQENTYLWERQILSVQFLCFFFFILNNNFFIPPEGPGPIRAPAYAEREHLHEQSHMWGEQTHTYEKKNMKNMTHMRGGRDPGINHWSPKWRQGFQPTRQPLVLTNELDIHLHYLKNMEPMNRCSTTHSNIGYIMQSGPIKAGSYVK